MSRERKRPAGGRVVGEIRQTRPFVQPDREMAVTLLRTSDVLHHAVECALRPWGVSPEQYNVMRILQGVAPRGLPTLEIADRMIARAPNVTRLIDKMVEKGLARRERCQDDRRVVRISATADSSKLLAEMNAAVDALLSARLGGLSARDLKGLTAQLDEVRARLTVPTAREAAGAVKPPRQP
jgi:DNA-binding MarR family transcriptional regulator